MDTFTWTPEFTSTKNSKPNVNPVKFGDGYEQRAAFGLNTNPKVWDLKFANRTISDIDAIEAFLDTQQAVQSFSWTPPRETDAVIVVCRQWQRSYDNASFDSLTATFEQVFEP